MTVRDLCRLVGQIIGVIALILFVPTAMILFMAYDSARWLFSRTAGWAIELQRRLMESVERKAAPQRAPQFHYNPRRYQQAHVPN